MLLAADIPVTNIEIVPSLAIRLIVLPSDTYNSVPKAPPGPNAIPNAAVEAKVSIVNSGGTIGTCAELDSTLKAIVITTVKLHRTDKYNIFGDFLNTIELPSLLIKSCMDFLESQMYLIDIKNFAIRGLSFLAEDSILFYFHPQPA
jgi:hypothetical protein